jgi:hypothetical protein
VLRPEKPGGKRHQRQQRHSNQKFFLHSLFRETLRAFITIVMTRSTSRAGKSGRT